MFKNIRLIFLLVIVILLPTSFVDAVSSDAEKTLHHVLNEQVETVKAVVVKVISQKETTVAGTDTKTMNQTVRVRILEGQKSGAVVEVDNDYINLQEGEIFYLRHTYGGADDIDYYAVDEPYRLPQLAILVSIFIIAVFAFGGIQGVRGLLSLLGSLILIVYVLLPGILYGISPLVITVIVSSIIIIMGSYITHGFNKTTSSAVIGMIITVLITGLFAYFAVGFTRLTGFGSEEVTYLNLNTQGKIDIIGLLLGGIMIGLLGVLYDVAIGQAISVEELMRIAPHVPKKIIYKRAVRIGREHIGALVNTLAIAYVGVALPLLLLFVQTNDSSMHGALITFNREIFATEIVRTMIGSIGLVIAVPITTMISIWFLNRKNKKAFDSTLAEMELKKLDDVGSHVGHSH